MGLQEVSDDNSQMMDAESSNVSTVDSYGNKVLLKLKPSGIVSQFMIDPDETSDDDNDPVAKMKIKEELREEHGPGRRSSQMMIEEADAIREKKA